MKIFKIFNYPVIFFVRGYQKLISPLLPHVCRFSPSCSQYTLECFRRFSFFRAFLLSCKRILRCHPFCEGGPDPVPEATREKKKA